MSQARSFRFFYYIRNASASAFWLRCAFAAITDHILFSANRINNAEVKRHCFTFGAEFPS
jgi:hypothetical protein